jgi:hypothetical protein
MSLAIQIIGWWVAFNVFVAPFLIWAFFRRRRQTSHDFHHWVDTHPDCPPEQMPAEIAINYFSVAGEQHGPLTVRHAPSLPSTARWRR